MRPYRLLLPLLTESLSTLFCGFYLLGSACLFTESEQGEVSSCWSLLATPVHFLDSAYRGKEALSII